MAQSQTLRSAGAPQQGQALTFADLRLNLAYSATYTHSQEEHAGYLSHLLAESEGGARAACWRCETIAVRFISPRTPTPVGLIVIAFCDNCQAWCLM